MAVGLPSQVIKPTAQSSPGWVQHLVNWAGTSWSYHPIQVASGAVWIQVGIGIWLVLARRGGLSRLAGLASVGWGLVVWVFGESFGGIFAPGLSWLTGAPGAALCYCAAGALMALPERTWRAARTGRLILGCFGGFLIAMAVLQAWPGRGFWQGDLQGQPGSLTSMVQSHGLGLPARRDQRPGLRIRLARAGARIRREPGRGSGPRCRRTRLADGQAKIRARRSGRSRPSSPWLTWVLVQDFGFFGGLGTDPDSMIPMVLLATAGFLALTCAPAASGQPQEDLQPDEPETDPVVPLRRTAGLTLAAALAPGEPRRRAR